MKQKLKDNNLCIPPKNNAINWDNWLSYIDSEITEMGYGKFNQNHKGEDFCYWKTFTDQDNNKIYQVGILVYDWRKYIDRDPIMCNRVGISFQCTLFSEGRIDLCVSNNSTSIHKFEEMALCFYKSMTNYII